MAISKYLIGLLTLLICPSCQKEGQWAHDQIVSSTKSSSSSKLTHRPNHSIYALTFELVETEKELKGYLLTHSTPLPEKGPPEQTPVTYKIDGMTFSAEGYRMRGGQRVLLNTELTQELIAALLSKKKIEISLPGYKTTLDSTGFAKAFEKFKHPKNTQNPFYWPWEL